MFLPKNTTSFLQSCDQGILWSFKWHYNRIFIRNPVNKENLNINSFKNIILLDGIYYSPEAWNLVTPDVIINCFIKKGLIFDFNKTEQETMVFLEEDESLLEDRLEELKQYNYDVVHSKD